MLEKQATHVSTLPSSPHKERTQQPPRSILKKPSLEPTSPSSPTFSWPLATPPIMSAPTDPFAVSGYRPSQWSVLSITKTHQQTSFPSSSPTNTETSLSSITVTLLYMPTETLYAWPFNLSSPSAKGVCYETHSREQDGEVSRMPPDGTMSTSLRVLADVIRSWMKIRRERSTLAQHRSSFSSSADGPSSPTTSSIDRVVDDDEVIDEIIDTLRLHQLTPFERCIYLLRQALPEPPLVESRHAAQMAAQSSRGRSHSKSSSSSGESDDDQDWRQRSDSSASSRASTVEASPDHSPQPKQRCSAQLSKIDTSVAIRTPHSPESDVPQIRLVEATPQDSAYEERDRVLEKATTLASRSRSSVGRSMDTVHEDDSEDIDAEVGTCDGEEVNLVKMLPCDRGVVAEDQICPKTLVPSVASTNAINFKPSKTSPSSPTKVRFRDPFKDVPHANSQIEIRVGATEHSSSDSIQPDPAKSKIPKRPSLDGLRSIFGSRRKSQ
ncbi:hypothetical protein PHSY_003871 [Pseudozyma hubeiensis SY62]|uniref:Uncharacterized protein n=1 Tax=Pseudozyma hubeiensis (strain SY62) TaxID=1305764 RepID=R9P4L5_PSEHS|nr:hypothetical protein PHSY_003871 [Pseudozyma hubeiensis SY62]GAC96291.1 hypothetical protein PHSY_003871 [Pseudozyma hubeiensis SY62]